LEDVLEEIKEEPYELMFEPTDIEPVLQGTRVQMIIYLARKRKAKK
jgi:hypothetical protein